MTQSAPSKCPLCGGDKVPGSTLYSVDLGHGVVVIRNVPALVCSKCGEEWIEHPVALKIEEIVSAAREKKNFVEVLPYPIGA